MPKGKNGGSKDRSFSRGLEKACGLSDLSNLQTKDMYVGCDSVKTTKTKTGLPNVIGLCKWREYTMVDRYT